MNTELTLSSSASMTHSRVYSGLTVWTVTSATAQVSVVGCNKARSVSAFLQLRELPCGGHQGFLTGLSTVKLSTVKSEGVHRYHCAP